MLRNPLQTWLQSVYVPRGLFTCGNSPHVFCILVQFPSSHCLSVTAQQNPLTGSSPCLLSFHQNCRNILGIPWDQLLITMAPLHQRLEHWQITLIDKGPMDGNYGKHPPPAAPTVPSDFPGLSEEQNLCRRPSSDGFLRALRFPWSCSFSGRNQSSALASICFSSSMPALVGQLRSVLGRPSHLHQTNSERGSSLQPGRTCLSRMWLCLTYVHKIKKSFTHKHNWKSNTNAR